MIRDAFPASGIGSSRRIWRKGSDLASADPLILDGSGNYHDVTGTTGISEIRVPAGTLFMLQFDGALTITDGAKIDLAGANITTATGDRGVFFATADNVVQMVAWVVEGQGVGQKWALLGTGTASASSSVDFESNINSTYHAYKIVFSGVQPATNDTEMQFRIGTGATPTYQSGASDYKWAFTGRSATGNALVEDDNADSEIQMASSTVNLGMGSAAGEDASGEITIYDPSATAHTNITYSVFYSNDASNPSAVFGGGEYASDTAVTAFRVMMATGNIAAGDFRLYGLKDA